MSVLLLGVVRHLDPEIKELSSEVEVLKCTKTDRNTFINDLSGKYSKIVGLFTTVEGLHDIDRLDEEVAQHLPKSVKFVCHKGAGYDLVEVDALTKRGIQLSNVPRAVDQSTSDTAIYLMIGAMRNFNHLANELRRGNWWYKTPEAHEPQGKTLGILGLGGIGRVVRDKALAIGVKKVIYYNRHKLSNELEGRAEYVSSLDELLAQSDIISLHTPLNDNTRHIINKESIAKCKDGVVFVNTGRGGLINEDDLVEALESGKVSTVGLDSYENEPEIHPKLLSNDNVLLLPHIGTHTVETRREMELTTLRNVYSGLKDGKVIDLVPEQAGKF